MDIDKKYVVYKLNDVLDSNRHQALEEVTFKWASNWFDTEDEAIQALVDDGKTYKHFVILKQVIIRT